MPLVSTCPKCDAPVLVPDGVDPSAKAKCPLCEAQFELQETLADLPPMLEILEQPNRPVRPLVAAAPVATPASDAEGESGDDVVFGDLADADDNSGSGFGAIDFGEVGGETDFGEAGFGDAEIGGAQAEATEGLFGAEGGSAADSSGEQAPASLATSARPKKRKGPNALVQIVGIAGFGIVGLMIGYLILVKIKGDQGDFLHVGKYLPGFIYTPGNNGSSNSNPKVIVKKSEKKKSKKNGNGGKDKHGKTEDQLPDLGFDFGDKKGKGNKQGKDRNDNQPPKDPVGPTALEQTLRHDIETALDEVSLKAMKLVAMQEKAKNQPKSNGEGKIDDLGRAERDHYFALAHLGLTMASAKQGSLNDKLTQRITQYVQNAVDNVDTREGIGEKAALWLNYERTEDEDGNVVRKGRLGRDGILIAGFLERAFLSTRMPGMYKAEVKIAGSDDVVTVVGAGNAPAAQAPILLLGAIIADPAQNLAGYHGDEKKVVWVSLPIDEPKQGKSKIDPDPGDEPKDEDPPEDVDEKEAEEEEEEVEIELDEDDSEPEADSIKIPNPVVPLDPVTPAFP